MGFTTAPTLTYLVEQRLRLDISCTCGRRVLIEPEEAVRRFGANTTFPALQERMKCASCGRGGRRGDGISCRPTIEDWYANLGMRAGAGGAGT